MRNYLMAHTGYVGRVALRFGADRNGVTAVEYAILAGVVIAALTGLGATFAGKVQSAFSAIGDKMTPTVAGG